MNLLLLFFAVVVLMIVGGLTYYSRTRRPVGAAIALAGMTLGYGAMLVLL